MISISDMVKPTLWDMATLFLKIVVVMTVGKFIVNKVAPGSGFAKLVNAA